MKSKVLIIHPGFSKTGTSSFQEILRTLNVNILAKPCENQHRTSWFKLFKSHLYHRIKPVTQGERRSLTYFFTGPRFT